MFPSEVISDQAREVFLYLLFLSSWYDWKTHQSKQVFFNFIYLGIGIYVLILLV
jgi:hypothetical protein